MLRLCKRKYSAVCPDFEPHSVINAIKSTQKKSETTKKDENKSDRIEEAKKPTKIERKTKINEMGIQMISRNLFKQIFRNVKANQLDKESIEQ